MSFYREQIARSILPSLVNEYSFNGGTLNPSEDGAFDLMEAWRKTGARMSLHPLSWLDTFKGRDHIKRIQRYHPEGTEDATGRPVYLSYDYEDEEFMRIIKDFARDPDMDSRGWLNEFRSLYVHPYLAKRYIERIRPQHKHTQIFRDLSNDFTYKGITFPGSNNRQYPLWDVLSPLQGFYIYPHGHNDIRSLRRTTTATAAATVHDVWHYGRPELAQLNISAIPLVGRGDTLALLGLHSMTAGATTLDEVERKRRYNFMEPARVRMCMTRRGPDPYLLVTKAMIRFLVDEAMRQGFMTRR